jgi:type III secretion system YscQ/HrcQ family protein
MRTTRGKSWAKLTDAAQCKQKMSAEKISPNEIETAAWKKANFDSIATDFFLQTAAAVSEETSKRLPKWFENLPKFSRNEICAANSIAKISAQTAARVCAVAAAAVSKAIFDQPDKVLCELSSSAEVDFAETIAAAENAVFIGVANATAKSFGFLILDAGFAVRAIEAAIGDDVSPPLAARRRLSVLEKSALEFFAANAVEAINNFCCKPLLVLRNVEQNAPKSSLRQGLLSKLRLQIGAIESFADLLLPFDFLENFEIELPNAENRLQKLKRFAPKVALRLQIGETYLTTADLAVLETGDAVLIEQIKNDTVRIGSEIYPSLLGELSNDKTKFALREISQTVENKKGMMPEINVENAGAGLDVEHLTLRLSIEMAARRITLEELSNLRVGQILELGTRPTDTVEIVADGKPVAVGELVDVEGGLAVRVKKLLI